MDCFSSHFSHSGWFSVSVGQSWKISSLGFWLSSQVWLCSFQLCNALWRFRCKWWVQHSTDSSKKMISRLISLSDGLYSFYADRQILKRKLWLDFCLLINLFEFYLFNYRTRVAFFLWHVLNMHPMRQNSALYNCNPKYLKDKRKREGGKMN